MKWPTDCQVNEALRKLWHEDGDGVDAGNRISRVRYLLGRAVDGLTELQVGLGLHDSPSIEQIKKAIEKLDALDPRYKGIGIEDIIDDARDIVEAVEKYHLGDA